VKIPGDPPEADPDQRAPGTGLFGMPEIDTEMSAALSETVVRPGNGRHEDVAVSPMLPQAVTVNEDPDPATPKLSVIIPTRNEADNISALLERLSAALAGTPAEVIFVDDSDDGTAEEIDRVGRRMRLPVRVLQRPADQRAGGLGTAVVAGMKAAQAPWALVMDADLQHPPEVAPQLHATGLRQNVDLVVASRYAGHGSSGGLDGAGRKNTSRFATRVAKLAFPRRAARVSDPMSGFFAVRLAALDLERLRPHGYKILLELIVRRANLRTAEVSFTFAPRHAGESKTSVREMLRFCRHLSRLRLQLARERSSVARGVPPLRSRLVLFGLVGVSGIAVNSAALWLFHFGAFQLHLLVAAALATQASTLWNFVLTDRVVFRTANHGRGWGRMWRFFLMNNLALLLRLPLLAVLVRLGLGVLPANVVTLLALFAVRYVISDRLIFGRPAETVSPSIERPAVEPVKHLVDLAADGSLVDRARPKRIRYLPYRYDVAGLVTIGSQVRLPELEYFRAQWLDGDMDIAVRVGDVGRGRPLGRAVVTQFVNPQALRYEEHLGRLGANFRVDLGSTIDVTVGPLLARSPHVVYTNILEALLRFVVADRGRMLLHSACIELDGRGVMLSARTDTGKTSTILRLLREKGGHFLSDDMTIIDEQASAWSFPKPLTISHHTLRAVEASDLTPAEWRRLKLQSRLHSKEGRSLAMILSRYNVPIMAINSLTQMAVPPPKYNVDRLVPCRTKASTQVHDLFLIERGPDRISNVTTEEAVDELMVNTADAYGFPPFQYLAPAIVLGDGDYAELQRKERKVLASAMSTMPVRRIASDSFGWADTIPDLLDRNFVVDTAPVEVARHPEVVHPRSAPGVGASAPWSASRAAVD
jgi:glycosyltransferase involved in cell wall biosynthesis